MFVLIYISMFISTNIGKSLQSIECVWIPGMAYLNFIYIAVKHFLSQHVAEILQSSGTGNSRLGDTCDGSFVKNHPLFSTERYTADPDVL